MSGTDIGYPAVKQLPNSTASKRTEEHEQLREEGGGGGGGRGGRGGRGGGRGGRGGRGELRRVGVTVDKVHAYPLSSYAMSGTGHTPYRSSSAMCSTDMSSTELGYTATHSLRGVRGVRLGYESTHAAPTPARYPIILRAFPTMLREGYAVSALCMGPVPAYAAMSLHLAQKLLRGALSRYARAMRGYAATQCAAMRLPGGRGVHGREGGAGVWALQT
eukprot:3351125-Rhodomonas_salina.1